MVWNSFPTYVYVKFPLIGGIAGGAICGAFVGVAVYFIKNQEKWWARLLIALASSILGVLVCYLVGYSVVSALLAR
jgi:hypothetical protein